MVGSSRVKSRELKYLGHISRQNCVEKDIMLGLMPPERVDKRRKSAKMAGWTVRVRCRS